jgi:hypothetical protein
MLVRAVDAVRSPEPERVQIEVRFGSARGGSG